ncbi:hypothetical protein, partial [Kitasatospora saccharophila]
MVLAPVTGAARKAGSPTKVRVELADQSVARRAGVHGVLFSLGGEEGAGAVDVKVDPSSFRAAFGGDYAARLRLVRLPACVLTTPERAECQAQSPVEAVPEVPLSARVDLSAAAGEGGAGLRLSSLESTPAGSGSGSGAMVLAATSAPDGSSGSYSATTLSPT